MPKKTSQFSSKFVLKGKSLKSKHKHKPYKLDRKIARKQKREVMNYAW